MFDLNEFLGIFAIVSTSAAFVTGLLITAITGSAKPVKKFMAVTAIIIGIAVVGGMIFSRGLLIYLLFQLISLVLLLFFVVVFGAVCGGGIYVLIHKKKRGRSLTQQELVEYLPASEFAALEGIDEERAQARIMSGFYQGGRYERRWYVHKSELSQATAKPV